MNQPSHLEWIGRTLNEETLADAWPAAGFAAVLDSPDRPAVNEPLPQLSHWCYFAPMVPQSELGADGHPQRGGFLPPIALPRRMWAASDLTFQQPIRVGQALHRRAEIVEVSEKQGASGPLIFVKVANHYSDAVGNALLREVQTLVYRDHPAPGEAPPPKPAPQGAEWSRTHRPDTAMLFRFSAVTFNAHRIHYDHPYATGVEGYPDVIVQGQLLATFMRRAMPVDRVATFSFRALRPVFADETVLAEGRAADGGGYELWIRDAAGEIRMQGRATVP
ncbi:MAG: acyl-CoA dehydrogenase [Rhodobacteraceae bacterium]|nr:acyl-CoA dehydrogenase [Paracoccaceae bacterium]